MPPKLYHTFLVVLVKMVLESHMAMQDFPVTYWFGEVKATKEQQQEQMPME